MVAVSSTEVYPVIGPRPTWRREDEVLQPPAESAAALALEAEDLLREVAEHQPHISIGILRLADLAGPGACSALASLLCGAAVPLVPGYDPLVQFLHPDDAARAIEHAVTLELAGTFNVTGDGVVRWRRSGTNDGATQDAGPRPFRAHGDGAAGLQGADRPDSADRRVALRTVRRHLRTSQHRFPREARQRGLPSGPRRGVTGRAMR